MDWTPIVVASIPTCGVVLATWVAAREHALKKQSETAELFLRLTRIASGTPGDGRESVPIEEQMGAIAALASLIRRHRWLRKPGNAVFVQFCRRGIDSDKQRLVVQAAQGYAHTTNRWWNRMKYQD